MKKADEEAKLLAMSKTEVIKVVREEVKKLRINPKKAISTKVGETFKKAQDAEHEVLKRERSKKVKRLTKLNKRRSKEYMWTMTNRIKLEPVTDVLNELFLELKDVSYNFIMDERCVSIDLVGLPLASWALEVYKKLGGQWGCSVFIDMVNDGPLSHGKVCVLTESLHRMLESFKVSYRNRSYCIIATEFAYWAPNIESTEDKSMTDSLERKDDEGPSLNGGPEHEEPLDVDNGDSVSSKDDNNDSDSSSEMSSTSRLMREVDVLGVDSDHVDSFEEGEIIGDSVLNNDGCVKDCMEKNLDDDVEKDIEYCSKNVTEKCGVNTSIPEVVKDLSSLDRSSDKAERLAHHNNGLDDLDISLCNRLLHQDKCWVRPVKAAVNDSSIVSPSTPPDFRITKLDELGPIIQKKKNSAVKDLMISLNKRYERLKKIPKELGIQYALSALVPEQASSQTSGRKRKHMELEPKVKEFQTWNDIHKVRVDSLVSYLVMASMVKIEENARFSLKLRKLIVDHPYQEKLKSKKVKLEALG
uniref:Uncharacterized protein n=1 Tax=Tanacetum cinerariifolium TaxID=118510 RepID=A0A6L2JPD4_TANCI|nr:hypothetical protein [Tanacetum cinerariifolium]